MNAETRKAVKDYLVSIKESAFKSDDSRKGMPLANVVVHYADEAIRLLEAEEAPKPCEHGCINGELPDNEGRALCKHCDEYRESGARTYRFAHTPSPETTIKGLEMNLCHAARQLLCVLPLKTHPNLTELALTLEANTEAVEATWKAPSPSRDGWLTEERIEGCRQWLTSYRHHDFGACGEIDKLCDMALAALRTKEG